VQVIAVGEHGPGASENAIHGACDARADGLHAASERALVIRFDDQMDVIPLDRIMDEAERFAFAPLSEGTFEFTY
jgi:hypothetical protein